MEFLLLLQKGLLRMIGTCLGGLAAWIGLMLCSLSYDGTSPANPFAWIAWLVVCLFMGNFSGKGKGISAFFGMDYSTGFAPFYFLITLSIVGMEAFYGVYEVNTGVANRVIANLLGIAMAMLVSILPPYYSGKDPQFVIEYCEALQQLQRSIALDFIENDGINMESVIRMEDEIETYRAKAEMLLVDSGRWSALPFFRAPPELKRILDILISEEAYLILVVKEVIDGKFFQSLNHDIAKPAYEEVLEGKDATSPAISKYLNEAGASHSRLFRSYLNRTIRLRILREKLEPYKQKGCLHHQPLN